MNSISNYILLVACNLSARSCSGHCCLVLTFESLGAPSNYRGKTCPPRNLPGLTQVKFGGGRSKTSPPTPGASSSGDPLPTSQQSIPRGQLSAGTAGQTPRSASASAQTRAQGVVSRDKPPLPLLTPESAIAAYAEPLPSFRDVAQAEKQLMFVKKLHLCSHVFDFTDAVLSPPFHLYPPLPQPLLN